MRCPPSVSVHKKQAVPLEEAEVGDMFADDERAPYEALLRKKKRFNMERLALASPAAAAAPATAADAAPGSPEGGGGGGGGGSE